MDYSVTKSTPDKMMIDGGKQLSQDFENHIYKSTNRELIKETDCKGNNNFSNSFKTENNITNSHNASSLFQGETNGDEQKPDYDMVHCEYANCKKAIDLTLHNRSCNGEVRTIFDDADYFSKNYSYKLLPINFQSVNETLIHSEHNYCHLSQSSGSEAEEDCSRTMDYNQVKEKNYKKRKAKFKGETILGMSENEKKYEENLNESMCLEATMENDQEAKYSNSNVVESENTLFIQPLDLSSPVLVQDDKTDNGPEENAMDKVIDNGPVTTEDDEDIEADVVEEDEKEDSVQFDSDKENQKSNKNLIEVTITRGDGKNKYEPCDSFLSDIARLVPKIAEKDCSGIDILDRTCGRYMNFEKHRLYYVISESTWRLFQNANERVILTNDRSLGQPVQRMESDGRPTFLIFDQFSLAKCLADYCKEKGGCFEYKFVEEEKEKLTELPEILHGTDTKKDENGPPEEEHSGSVPSNQCQIADVNENFESEKSQIQKCSGNTSLLVEVPDETLFKKASSEFKKGREGIRDAEENVSLPETNVPVEGVKEESEVVEKKEPVRSAIQNNGISNEVKSDLVVGKIEKEVNKAQHSLPDKRNDYSCNKLNSTVVVETRSSAETNKRKQVGTPKRAESNRQRARGKKDGSKRSSDSSRLSATENLGARKRTSSIKSEETNEKKLKIEEESVTSVRTRSKSVSEAEVEKRKTVTSVTSQKSDNNSKNNSRRVSKRPQASSENVQKSNEKGEIGKEKKKDSSVPVEKRKTRSEVENIQGVGNNNNNKNSSSGNSNTSNRRRLRNSVTKDEPKIEEVPKKETIPNTRSAKKKAPEKQEEPKEPVKERWSLRSQTGNSATTAGKNATGAAGLTPLKAGSESSKKKTENPMKRRGSKEDQSKVLPKRRRR